jgi:hypothetical protein
MIGSWHHTGQGTFCLSVLNISPAPPPIAGGAS